MAVKTSLTAEVRWNNTKIAKIRDISMDVFDESSVYGVRSTTGSGTLMYDPADATTVSLMNSIFSNTTEATDSLTMVLDTANGKQISGSVLLTQLQAGVSVGDVIAVPVQFKVNNKPTHTF
jgi:urease alpha subunit